MNDFMSQIVLPVLGTAALGASVIVIALMKKLWTAVDSYLKTKAANYATKQDVALITAKTEEVQAVFKKDFEKFDADLQFKYKLYEDQYTDLYAKLYQLICQSESLRYLLVKQNMPANFKEVPIVELVDREASSITQTILKLINDKHAKATPELIKIVNLLGVLERIRRSHESTETDAELEIKLKANLVKTILKDCHWLRAQLRLPYCDKEIEYLDTDSFLREAII
jgi:hypothetical protein